jgi:hypothetical protein
MATTYAWEPAGDGGDADPPQPHGMGRDRRAQSPFRARSGRLSARSEYGESETGTVFFLRLVGAEGTPADAAARHRPRHGGPSCPATCPIRASRARHATRECCAGPSVVRPELLGPDRALALVIVAR